MTERRTFVSAAVWLAILILAASATSAGALDGQPSRAFVLTGPQIESAGDSLKVLVPGVWDGGRVSDTTDARDRGGRHTKIIGTSLFSSGLFLCSWGITSWQFEDDQCCPARNTENVLKIIVGVVLVNAGIVYLLGGVD